MKMNKVMLMIVGAALAATWFLNAESRETCACGHHHGRDEVNGRSDIYKRLCPVYGHGWYDIRFGGCPACRAPKFGF